MPEQRREGQIVTDKQQQLDQMHRSVQDAPQHHPPQHQDRQPGIESEMHPQPIFDDPAYRPAGKLEGHVALVTGGDSGIGRAVAICFAKEGADVAIVYLDEHEDAQRTVQCVEQYGRRCIAIAGDVGDESFCKDTVQRVVQELGQIDLLVNNAAEQHLIQQMEDIDAERLERTFRTNVFGLLFMSKAAVPHLKPGAAIINTSSIEAFKPLPGLMPYAATKAAVLNLTRSMARELTPKGIRVNAVAPGPVWTPLIPASFPAEAVETFGADSPKKRPAQPAEIAPAYVFLASERDSSYISGEVILATGGKIGGGA